MVSFQRMKDEFDDLGNQVSQKLPIVSKSGLFIGLVILSVILLIGFGIGYGSAVSSSSSMSDKGRPTSEALKDEASAAKPFYIFLKNNTGSCPTLEAERLLTTMDIGESFEGLVVNLACRGDYTPFPNQLKCRRTSDGEDLEWSHLPVCYPSVLVSKVYWSKTLHARSVSCTGDSAITNCRLSCIHDYIPVERRPYVCTQSPCKAWTLGESRCYMCDKNCSVMHDVGNPNPASLLSTLTCDSACDQLLVNSEGKAAIWQNKRTGLFTFIGEHNGRPVYQSNATKEFLFYTLTGSQWLVGPDFRKPHAGIQIFGNEDTQCPERNGGRNVSRLYIDSSEPSVGGTGKWTEDKTLNFKCLTDEYLATIAKCDCRRYKVYNLVYVNATVPAAVEYLSGNFSKVDEKAKGLLAPLYFDKAKGLYLFSHHPRGRVWQVSSKLSTTPLRGVYDGKDNACPDNDLITWEWFNMTTPLGQQLYVPDRNIKVKCILK